MLRERYQYGHVILLEHAVMYIQGIVITIISIYHYYHYCHYYLSLLSIITIYVTNTTKTTITTITITSAFGLLSGGNFFEAGISNDEHYFKRRQVISGDIVYVVTSDLPQFIETVFVHLPKSSRIVVVTGCEDIGAPWEIFHPNRTNFGKCNDCHIRIIITIAILITNTNVY